jgi:hypothetical protein
LKVVSPKKVKTMPIDLEEERQISPTVKLPNVGDSITGAIVHKQQRDVIDPQTGEKKLKPDGKPKQMLILTILVKDSNGAQVGKSGEWRSPEPGETARLFVEGGTWHWWIEATRNHHLQVGDVVRWYFECERENPNPAQSDYKDRKFLVRKPKPGEENQTAECERLYQETQATQAPAVPPVSEQIDF